MATQTDEPNRKCSLSVPSDLIGGPLKTSNHSALNSIQAEEPPLSCVILSQVNQASTEASRCCHSEALHHRREFIWHRSAVDVLYLPLSLPASLQPRLLHVCNYIRAGPPLSEGAPPPHQPCCLGASELYHHATQEFRVLTLAGFRDGGAASDKTQWFSKGL